MFDMKRRKITPSLPDDNRVAHLLREDLRLERAIWEELRFEQQKDGLDIGPFDDLAALQLMEDDYESDDTPENSTTQHRERRRIPPLPFQDIDSRVVTEAKRVASYQVATSVPGLLQELLKPAYAAVATLGLVGFVLHVVETPVSGVSAPTTLDDRSSLKCDPPLDGTSLSPGAFPANSKDDGREDEHATVSRAAATERVGTQSGSTASLPLIPAQRISQGPGALVADVPAVPPNERLNDEPLTSAVLAAPTDAIASSSPLRAPHFDAGIQATEPAPQRGSCSPLPDSEHTGPIPQVLSTSVLSFAVPRDTHTPPMSQRESGKRAPAPIYGDLFGDVGSRSLNEYGVGLRPR